MRHRVILVVTLLTLSAVGLWTILLTFSPDLPTTVYSIWWLFLILMPLALGSAVMMGWTWAAMACVVYGTIGLAVDLATVVSILGRQGPYLKLILSLISGSANVLLIVFGGRAFWSALGNQRPPGSRHPSPPPPSSS